MPPPTFAAPHRRQHKAAEALHRAIAMHRMGDLVEAERLYKLVLRKAPDQFDALHLLGLVEAQRGRLDKAERLIRQAVKVNPASAEAFSNLGNVQHQLARFDAALASYDQALRLNPAYANALNNRGNVLLALGQPAEATTSFDAALALEPRFGGAHYNRGIALRAQDQPEAALASFTRAAEFEPANPAIHVDRGIVLVALRRIDEALAAFDRALALAPAFAEAHYNRGVALLHRHALPEALASFDRAIAARPDFAAALGNRGNVLVQMGRIDEALASFERAIAADPTYLPALADHGHAAFSAGRYEEAAKAFARLVERNAGFPFAIGNMFISKMYCCDWRGFDDLQSRMQQGVRTGKPTILPGHLLSLSDSSRDQLQAAQTWVKEICPHGSRPPQERRYRHDRIRLAYLSANLNQHAIPIQLIGLFERHDRTQFETFALSWGLDDKSELRARLVRAFDHFVDVKDRTDEQIAAFIESQEIDIAVDLVGFADGARPGIFMLRPADIQTSYHGFPGTTALDCIDYIIADPCIIPDADDNCFSERIVHLPDTYFAHDPSRPISERTPTRAEAGLPDSGFVFCAFNNQYKITPEMFAAWMRLLQAVEESVLWLRKAPATAFRNLREAAHEHGMSPDRLVFAEPVEAAGDHIARHRLADLFLDTYPYNAHTTACDALWGGLPVLTRVGNTFAGRVAASLLNAVGLPELVAKSLPEYEALAIELARDAGMLSAIKAKLARNRLTHPLFDADRFRCHIEQAFMTMHERHRRGEPPASFAVTPLRQPQQVE